MTWSPGSPASCSHIESGTLDVDFDEIRGVQSRLSFVENVPNPTGYDQGIVVFDDHLALASGSAPSLLSEMYTSTMPQASDDIVAAAVGYYAGLPMVGDYAGTNEDGIALLREDGPVLMYARDGSGYFGSSGLPWPSHYEYRGAVTLPSLPGGVAYRLYCDVEIANDGDLVVTFAQSPGVSMGNDTYLREGWLRYDRSVGAWEAAVTSYLGISFLHPAKGFEQFERTSCMAVDYARDISEFAFTSNLSSVSTNPKVWRFDYVSTEIFTTLGTTNMPTGGGLGSIEDVAVVGSQHFVVTQDTGAADLVRLMANGTSVPLATTSLANLNEITGVAVSSRDVTNCNGYGYTVWASGDPLLSQFAPSGQYCRTFFEVPMQLCP